MSAHPQTGAMVADFLARGGCVQKFPEATPTSVCDILLYLDSLGVKVESVPAANFGGIRYMYDGDVTSLESLLALANQHRKWTGLAPFELQLRH